MEHEEASERLHQFLTATEHSDFEVVEDSRIPWMMQQPEWRRCAGRVGKREPIDDPVFFFNTF